MVICAFTLGVSLAARRRWNKQEGPGWQQKNLAIHCARRTSAPGAGRVLLEDDEVLEQVEKPLPINPPTI